MNGEKKKKSRQAVEDLTCLVTQKKEDRIEGMETEEIKTIKIKQHV